VSAAGCRLSSSLSLCIGGPVAGGPGLDDVAAEGEVVEDGDAEPWVGGGLGPAAEALVAGDGDAVGLLTFGKDREQQFGAAGVLFLVAGLVGAELSSAPPRRRMGVEPPPAGGSQADNRAY